MHFADCQPIYEGWQGGEQTLKVLKAAFAEAPKQIPKTIVKLYCATVETGGEIDQDLG